MIKSISKMAIVVMVLVALATFAMPASASGDPGSGCPVDTMYHSTINGDIYFEHKGALSYSPMTETFDVPAADNIKLAKIYTGIWGGSPGKGGMFNITVVSGTGTYTTPTYQSCDPCPGEPCGYYPGGYQNDNTRCDSLIWAGNVPPNLNPSPDDIRGRITGCNVQFISFNATPYITSGINTITVNGCGGSCADNCSGGAWDGRIYLTALLVVYEDESMPEITYWIDEGAAAMETGSACDGPLDHHTASYYFNGTGMVTNPSSATYEVLGWPHVINAGVPGVSSTELNSNDIGAPDHIGYAGSWDIYARYDDVDVNHIHPTTNFMDYWDSAAVYERSHVAWLVVKGPGNHSDLAFPGDPVFPDVMRPDKDYTISATVKNYGTDPSGSFSVSLLVDDVPTSTASVSELSGGESTTVSFTNVNLPSVSCYDFKMVADCNNEVDESNEANNELARDYQVGYYIVVDGNAGFDALLDEVGEPGGLPPGTVVKTGDTYYIQNLDITNCPDWGENHGYGILIENTNVPFVITNCTIHDCGVDGVRLRNLVDGKVNDCTAESNNAKGIRLMNCSHVEIDNNLAQNNEKYGIDVYMEAMPTVDCEFINITGNTLIWNQYGIEMLGDNCTVSGNIIQNSGDYGIYMFGDNNEIFDNTIENSGDYALKLDDLIATSCSGNYLYRNDIRGNGGVSSQAYDTGTNTWNTPALVDYNYSGTTYDNYTGNYWSDYGGSDPDGDGIGNTAYALAGGTGAEDSYPMILPWWGDTFDIPIYTNNNDPKNLISLPLQSDQTTLAEVIGSDAVDGDTVYRYVNGAGYSSATYYGGTWYGATGVEPVEPEVGYEYRRMGGAFNITNTGQLLPDVNTTIYGEVSTGDGKNLIGYASFTETDLSSAFNEHAIDGDTVYRYVNGDGYSSATYYGSTWYGSGVDPIEPGVGYEYRRVDATFYWTYNP